MWSAADGDADAITMRSSASEYSASITPKASVVRTPVATPLPRPPAVVVEVTVPVPTRVAPPLTSAYVPEQSAPEKRNVIASATAIPVPVYAPPHEATLEAMSNVNACPTTVPWIVPEAPFAAEYVPTSVPPLCWKSNVIAVGARPAAVNSPSQVPVRSAGWNVPLVLGGA